MSLRNTFTERWPFNQIVKDFYQSKNNVHPKDDGDHRKYEWKTGQGRRAV